MKANGDKDQLYNLFNGCKECQLIRWENNFYRGSTGDICVKAGNKKCVDSVFDELFWYAIQWCEGPDYYAGIVPEDKINSTAKNKLKEITKYNT